MVEEKKEVADLPKEEPQLNEPDQPIFDIIKKTNEAADRVEKANDKMEVLLDRQEALYVENRLGGQTSAGNPVLSEEDKVTAECKEMLKKVGLEDSANL